MVSCQGDPSSAYPGKLSNFPENGVLSARHIGKVVLTSPKSDAFLGDNEQLTRQVNWLPLYSCSSEWCLNGKTDQEHAQASYLTSKSDVSERLIKHVPQQAVQLLLRVMTYQGVIKQLPREIV